MDYTFSTTGAIRQQQQSIRNLASSPHNLYRISPTNNILGTGISFNKSSPTGNLGTTPATYQTTPQSHLNLSPTPITNFYRIPTTLSAQQSQQSFGITSTAGTVVDSSYLQGGIHTRIGTGQFPLQASSSVSTRTANPALSITAYSGISNTPGSTCFSSNPLIENNLRKPKQHHHQQFTTGVSQQSQQSMQQANSQTMNKNRFASSQSTVQTSMNCGVTGAGDSCSTTANVKALIQHISQSQPQPQQNVNNNVAASSSSIPQSQPQQPQYRIFKRGDSIPGISSPIQLTPNLSANNDNSSSGGSPGAKNTNGSVSTTVSSNNDDNGNAKSNTDSTCEVSSTCQGSEGQNGNDKENGTPIGTKEGSTLIAGSLITSATGTRTPLSQIGEIARFHSLTVEYRLVKETGPPHAPTFTVLLRLGNDEYTGEGSSIKKAQHAAAVEALEKTSIARPPPRSKAKKPFTPGGNKRPNWALIQLTALAQELQLQLQFVQQPVPIVDPFRRGDPPSIVSVHVGDKIFTGEGSNFNSAKNMAVMVALKAMIKVKQEMDLAKLAQVGVEEPTLDMENKSPISIVHEMAMKRGLPVAFEITQETGPPHMKVFTVKCKVSEDLETDGQGPTKQAAKKASSELMIAKLKEIPITLPATSQGINLKAMQRGLFRQKAPKKKTSTPVVKDLEKQTVSPISRLIQIAHIKKFKEPEFTLISTGTESNVESFLKQITERDRRMLRKKKPVFTIEVSVGPHACRGTGPNKKAAKKAAAEAAIIALGYGPADESPEEGTDPTTPTQTTSSNGQGGSPTATNTKTGAGAGKSGNTQVDGKTNSATVKLAGARQIAPGIIILKSESSGASGATTTAVVQEMKKVNTMTSSPSASNREGIEKLAYLSKLLEITVSYSDFPKKNEYLSVVSLTTNPPHVAHGCGATLEEAQNAAALKILEELSTMGLDSVTAAAEKSSE